MPRRPRAETPSDIEYSDSKSDLVRELERLSQETVTDRLLDSLERELMAWAPDERDEADKEEVIDRLNRDLVAKSVFRESLDLGYHEDVGNQRPIETEVRKGLEDLRKLIEAGRPSREK